MKKLLTLFFLFASLQIQAGELIRIHTDRTDLIYQVNEQGCLLQHYLGPALADDTDLALIPAGESAYVTYGSGDFFTPALRVTHADGNTSLRLTCLSHTGTQVEEGVTETRIRLRDEVYPVDVTLVFRAFERENVIVSHMEISHRERKSLLLHEYASSMLRLQARDYYLTEFSGNWAREANISTTRLNFGKKVLETTLGTRANLFCSPMFALSLDGRMAENSGTVLLGTQAWSGNFRFTFEVDPDNRLRILSGINPAASDYRLEPSEVFRTPDFIFTLSCSGAGEASRSLHDWARNHRLKDGAGDRMTLLNNWEATYFKFNEAKLDSIMDDAAGLGVNLFLLDDGWFGNKYPRSSAHQGLGDWEETREKLPGGIARLVEKAEEKGVRFGLWIEPEMVNPRSELYEKHCDWVLRDPNREEIYYRNQLVLDLSNPEVQNFVFGVVDRLLTEAPGIAYFKWDCNSPIMNAHSAFLGRKQSHLWIDYVRGLYRVLDRIRAKYPDLPMMLCSGGGGRTDYEALRYFTEFWPSDNTDPFERIFIQWGFSYFFPMKSICAHVTNWNKGASIKFRTDVAMMGKLGFDIIVDKLTAAQREFCRQALRDYDRLKPTILDGDFYRLVSPYEGEHAAVQSVSKDRKSSVVFAYDLQPRYREPLPTVRLSGLDPQTRYRIREINLMPGQKSRLALNGRVVGGDYLMKVGLPLFTAERGRSAVVELQAE